MTLREKIKRAASLNSQMRTARERLGKALGASDYDKALQCQIEVRELERELRNLDDPYLPMGAVSRWIPANSNFRLRYDSWDVGRAEVLPVPTVPITVTQATVVSAADHLRSRWPRVQGVMRG
jgi:hypothetical protein